MKNLFRKTTCDQLQADLNNLTELANKPMPRLGWIKTIRNALGMTSYQLAKRIGCSQSNVIALEQREKTGSISIKALNQAAKAMNCRCVYFLIPQKSFTQIKEDQAKVAAKKRLSSVQHSMKLEQQGLTPQQTKQQEEMLEHELLNKQHKLLWKD